jgi:hypothetical protein
MKKLNCWEFKKCARQAGGEHAQVFGVCPSSVEKRLDGVHDGNRREGLLGRDRDLVHRRNPRHFRQKVQELLYVRFLRTGEERRVSEFQIIGSSFKKSWMNPEGWVSTGGVTARYLLHRKGGRLHRRRHPTDTERRSCLVRDLA